uniref:Alpha putative n=1 Tax=Albugo laibachii Nc14 TaxID=890382 RepID=F0WPX5_9STRA|nr:alpha putative [Albugo laibachii Nc14]|eukprot:CCA23376.1 alpha putative [Albugo laibachii Nc14]
MNIGRDRSLRSLTTSTDPSQPGGKCPSCGMSTTKMGYNNLNYVEFTNGQRIYSCGMEPRAFEAYPFQVTDTAYIAANMAEFISNDRNDCTSDCPLCASGTVRDPVDGQVVSADAFQFVCLENGQKLFFASKETKAKYLENVNKNVRYLVSNTICNSVVCADVMKITALSPAATAFKPETLANNVSAMKDAEGHHFKASGKSVHTASAGDGSDPATFCTGEGSVMFNGFQLSASGSCVRLFFTSWVLNTEIKYALGFAGVFLIAVFNEFLATFRERFRQKMRESPGTNRLDQMGKKGMLVTLYMIQMTIAYFAMLVVMIYETGLFIALMMGFCTGFLLFKNLDQDVTLERGSWRYTDPSTVCLQVEGMTCMKNCGVTIENALQKVNGVTRAFVDFTERKAYVAGTADFNDILSCIESSGYSARIQVDNLIESIETGPINQKQAADMSDKDANECGRSTTPSALSISTGNALPTTTSTATSPRNEFYVSQRMTADSDPNRINSLSVEEQEILANIQDLQLQLMKLRAEHDEDSDDEEHARFGSIALASSMLNKTTSLPSSQLIIVSNTLPIVLERVPQTGRWKAIKTTGGWDKLMCLTGVRQNLQFIWIGHVGQHIPKNEEDEVRRLLKKHNFVPVFFSSESVTNRYNVFSSEVLWSLFHYVAEPVATSTFTAHGNGACASQFYASKRFNKQDWRAYEAANESFADTIAEVYNEGDSVWVHDYHLMLLPALLRLRIPSCYIGWFLHSPFPTSDVYTRIPVRSQLLTGVLQADLVGFQTFDYERHFLSACKQLLGVECSYQVIRSPLADRDHFTSIGVFPIGINIEPFAKAAASASTLHRVEELHRKFGDKRIILGVDRLDNVKGIPHKLLAMECLLEKFPEWQNNVVLVQIGITSRSGGAANDTGIMENTTTEISSSIKEGNESVPGTEVSASDETRSLSRAESDQLNTSKERSVQPPTSELQQEMSSNSYRNLLSHVNQLVGRINGTFGGLHYAPIHFLHQTSTSHEELCALYDLADVCLVTSTRDGMNLVSHEFIVCQQHFTSRKDHRHEFEASPQKEIPSQEASSSLTKPDESSSPLSSTDIMTQWEGEEGGPGVLVLSEFAGCSHSLSGAIVVNPWNTENVALTIHQALGMCRTERELRQQKLYRYVSTNTAKAWGLQFLNALNNAAMKNRGDTRQLPKLDQKAIMESYKSSENRVIILDYDRSLCPQPSSLLPLAAVGPNFKSLLDALTADPRNTVFIVSGRERKFIETWLNGVRVGVAAEDGFFYRMNLQNPRERWKTMSKFQYDVASSRLYGSSAASTVAALHSGDADHTRKNRSTSVGSGSMRSRTSLSHPGSAASPTSATRYPLSATGLSDADDSEVVGAASGGVENLDIFQEWSRPEDEDNMSWKNLVLPTMELFTDRTPGSYIEEKESSLTWHYCDADSQFGSWQAKDLQIMLERQLIGTALDVYQGQFFVSVEHEGCTKAKVVEGILKYLSLPQQLAAKNMKEVDFVLCVCDDVSDDQMFQTLHALSIESKERHERQSRESDTSARPKESMESLEKKKSSTTEEEKELECFVGEDPDNMVTFSRLHKVPVRMSTLVSMFTVVVGSDVRHSASSSRHQRACVVDSLVDVRNVLREFVDISTSQ